MSDAYPWVLALGALAGLLWIARTDSDRPDGRSTQITPIHRIDAGLAALASGMLGARAGFVLSHGSYVAGRPFAAAAFWEGGLSWAGGAVGALIGLAVYAKLAKGSFWRLADGLAIPAVILSAAAWLGCMLDGCSYGRRTQPGPLAPLSPDWLGNLAPRWPTQMLGALYSLILLGGLLTFSERRLPPGVLAGLALTLLAAGSLVLSFTRGDPARLIWGMRLDGVASGVVLALGVGSLSLRIRKG